jgi:hypothetical protein
LPWKLAQGLTSLRLLGLQSFLLNKIHRHLIDQELTNSSGGSKHERLQRFWPSGPIDHHVIRKMSMTIETRSRPNFLETTRIAVIVFKNDSTTFNCLGTY